MERYRRGVCRQRQAVLAEHGRDDVAERARGVHVYVGLVVFQARPELCPARRAAHAAAAQSRSFSAQLVAKRFYPQFEHAVAVGLYTTTKQNKSVINNNNNNRRINVDFYIYT